MRSPIGTSATSNAPRLYSAMGRTTDVAMKRQKPTLLTHFDHRSAYFAVMHKT